MSTAVAEHSEGFTLPIKEGGSLFLPKGSFTPVLGWHHAPVLLRVDQDVHDEDGHVVAEPGVWFNMNRARGSYGRSETIHRADLSVAHAVLATGQDDPYADNMEPDWIKRLLREVPDVLYVMAKKGVMPNELDWAQDQLRELLLDGPGMQQPRDPNKKEIQSRFLRAIQGIDSTGRRNRLAMSAQAVPTLTFAKKRGTAMQIINRLLDLRRAPIRRIILENGEIVRDALAKVRSIRVRWGEPSGNVKQRYVDVADLMKSVMDRPWRPTFDRCLDDLRSMYEHHGSPRGLEYADKTEISLELLSLYDTVADIDTRRSQNDARLVRSEAKKAAKMAEYRAIADQAKLLADHLPEGEDDILDSPVVPKLRRRLLRAAGALRRGDYKKAKVHFGDALGAFGG